jgi:hypothetical protein
MHENLVSIQRPSSVSLTRDVFELRLTRISKPESLVAVKLHILIENLSDCHGIGPTSPSPRLSYSCLRKCNFIQDRRLAPGYNRSASAGGLATPASPRPSPTSFDHLRPLLTTLDNSSWTLGPQLLMISGQIVLTQLSNVNSMA